MVFTKMDKVKSILYIPRHWRISNVLYRGKTLTVDLLGDLLPKMTQEQAGAYARANPDEFVARDLPMYFAILSALEQQRDLPGASAPVEFLRKSMRSDWLQTLTAIDYLPEGKRDVVTHGVGTGKPYRQKVDVVGPDRQIMPEDSACLEALVGTGDVETVKRVLTFIHGTPTYLWRVNYKPSEVARRVAGFNAPYSGFGLDCYRDPRGSSPALGVRRVAPRSGA